ncbi:MAG: hypothetical protein ACREXP_12720, partial [Steroidobacteraceae bacterium]
MRFALIPWIVLSAVAVASAEVTLPCACVAQQEPAEPIETITRDISLASHAHAKSLESMPGGCFSGCETPKGFWGLRAD